MPSMFNGGGFPILRCLSRSYNDCNNSESLHTLHGSLFANDKNRWVQVNLHNWWWILKC